MLSIRSIPGGATLEPILLVSACPAIGCADERVCFCAPLDPDGRSRRDRSSGDIPGPFHACPNRGIAMQAVQFHERSEEPERELEQALTCRVAGTSARTAAPQTGRRK